MDNTDWRGRLAQALKDKGRSPRDVSLRIDRAAGYVWSLLAEGKEPGLSSFVKICEEIGVSPMYILFGVDEKDPESAQLFSIFSRLNEQQRRAFLQFVKTFPSPNEA